MSAATRRMIASVTACASSALTTRSAARNGFPTRMRMSRRQKAERLARRDHVERHPQRAAVGLAPPDRERADSAQEEADDRRLEELALAHVADGVTKRELDPRRVFPVDVVRDEDVAAAPRDVLAALETPRREERGERANDRKPDTPDPEPFLGKDRRTGKDGQERVTCSTRSSASPTERPSVSTSIASLAALRGATVRVLSSSSRRRI